MIEFRAPGKKLFLSLLVLVFMVLYLLPKGKQFITWVGGVCSNAAGLLLDTVSIH